MPQRVGADMNHITQEQADDVVTRLYTQCADWDGKSLAVAFANAAIEWYIAQQAAPTKEPQGFTQFGGCPFCGRKDCVAGSCRAAQAAPKEQT